jgi:hypothetical protein
MFIYHTGQCICVELGEEGLRGLPKGRFFAPRRGDTRNGENPGISGGLLIRGEEKASMEVVPCRCGFLQVNCIASRTLPVDSGKFVLFPLNLECD